MMEELDDNEILKSIRPTSDFTNINNNSSSSSSTTLVAHAHAPSPTSSMPYIKKAILSKKGMGKMLRPWVLRTVILDNNHKLLYYDIKTLKGEISLEGVTVKHIEPSLADGRSFAFELSNIPGVKKHQNASLILAASCVEDANDWVDCLTKASNTSPAVKKGSDITGYESFEEASSQKPMDIKKIKEERQRAYEEKQRSGNYDLDDEEEDYEQGTFN